MGRSRQVRYISQNQMKLLDSRHKFKSEKDKVDLDTDLDSSNDLGRRSPLLQINKNLDTQVNVPSASTSKSRRSKCDDETAQNATLQLCDENETTYKPSQLNWNKKEKLKYDATFENISKMKPDDSKYSPTFTAPNTGGLEWRIGIKFKSGLTPRRLYFYLICTSDLRPVKAVEIDATFNIKRRKCHSKSKKVVCEHHKKGSWFSMSSEPETILTINKLDKNIFGQNNFVSWVDIMEPLNHIFDDDDKIMVEVVFHILNVQNLPQITQDLKYRGTIPFVNLGNKWVEKPSKPKIQRKKKITQKDIIVNAIFRPKKLVTNSVVSTVNSPKMEIVSKWLLTTTTNNLSTPNLHHQQQQQQNEIERKLNMDLLDSISKLGPKTITPSLKNVKSNSNTTSSEQTIEKKIHWKVKKSIKKQERLSRNQFKKSKLDQIKRQIDLGTKIDKNVGEKSTSTTTYNYVKKAKQVGVGQVKRKGRKSVKKPNTIMNIKQENEIVDDNKLDHRISKEIKGTKTTKKSQIDNKLVQVQKSIRKFGRKKKKVAKVIVENKVKSLQKSKNPGKTPPENVIISKNRKFKNYGSSKQKVNSKISKKKIVSPPQLPLKLAENPDHEIEIEPSRPQTRNVEKPLNNTNDDCIHYFFKHGGCQRESYCPFRHSDLAKESYLVCGKWRKFGECSKWILCTKRHMSEEDIENYKRKYFIIDDE